MTEPMPREPHEGIKADANVESEAVERDQSSYVARGGSSSGTVSSGPAPGDEQPSQAVGGGTASGDALSGVTAGDDDVADVDDAVSGDTGPAHPGTR
jgi:hypothetical protein